MRGCKTEKRIVPVFYFLFTNRLLNLWKYYILLALKWGITLWMVSLMQSLLLLAYKLWRRIIDLSESTWKLFLFLIVECVSEHMRELDDVLLIEKRKKQEIKLCVSFVLKSCFCNIFSSWGRERFIRIRYINCLKQMNL